MRDTLEKTRHRLRSTPLTYRRRYAMTGRKWMTDVLYAGLMRRESHWMGVPALKNPLDIWIYQEILFEVQPTAIVEIGSALGGGTQFLCHMLDLIGLDGPVITVDLSHDAFQADHPRIHTITGDSRDREVVKEVRDLCNDRKVLVLHDGDHSAPVVLEDLRNYGPLVTSGSYLIVEDGVNDFLGGVAGPVTAIRQFLSETSDFEVDEVRERLLFTYNPRGFLRRR